VVTCLAGKEATSTRWGQMDRALDAAQVGSAALERTCDQPGLASGQPLAGFWERASRQEAEAEALLNPSCWRAPTSPRGVFGPLRPH
jgi:hypothetical protein